MARVGCCGLVPWCGLCGNNVFYVNMSSRKIYERVHVCVLDIIYLLWLCPARPLVCSPCLGESYWLPSWLSLSVFVPWNKSSRGQHAIWLAINTKILNNSVLMAFCFCFVANVESELTMRTQKSNYCVYSSNMVLCRGTNLATADT